MVGSAYTAVDFFNTWAIDEIILLDISRNNYGIDAKFLEIVRGLSKRCFVPLSVGGKITNVTDAEKYIKNGADKIVVNTGAVKDSNLIPNIKAKFGSQCCILSIDAGLVAGKSGYFVFTDNGSSQSGIAVKDWVEACTVSGAGELMVNSLDFDGNREGYDISLLKEICSFSPLPVIAMGGVGKWEDFCSGIEAGADAVAAGNIFHYTEQSTKKAKQFLQDSGYWVRPPAFYKNAFPRDISYKVN